MRTLRVAAVTTVIIKIIKYNRHRLAIQEKKEKKCGVGGNKQCKSKSI